MPNLNGGSVYLPIAQAAGSILDSDLLLFRGAGLIARSIRITGRSIHTHAAKASWHRNGTLMCLEVREFIGGRATTLGGQVRKYPRRIDVFRANAGDRWPNYDRMASDRYMTELTDTEYGWWNLARSSLLHWPVVRWTITPPTQDAVKSTHPPYCSAACAMADDYGGGVDVVPHLANWAVHPGDLARSLFYEYLFTLEP